MKKILFLLIVLLLLGSLPARSQDAEALAALVGVLKESNDAAFQLASYFLKQIQERGLIKDIKEVEVVLRGFGSGREAATKVILGQEGRLIRSKIVAVTDATRLKFGGSRSPNPRRLG